MDVFHPATKLLKTENVENGGCSKVDVPHGVCSKVCGNGVSGLAGLREWS